MTTGSKTNLRTRTNLMRMMTDSTRNLIGLNCLNSWSWTRTNLIGYSKTKNLKS